MGGRQSKSRDKSTLKEQRRVPKNVVDETMDSAGGLEDHLGPGERAERRFLRSFDGDEAGSGFADVDQSVDRYDYLIVFPRPQEMAHTSQEEQSEER
ncbi:unnamed protein product, partial [Choristocarpus tenellus]